MKVLFFALAFIITSLGCKKEEKNNLSVTTVSFKVDGMVCTGCEDAIKNKVSKLEGVKSVTAFHKEGVANITYDSTKITPNELSKAIAELNYTVLPKL